MMSAVVSAPRAPRRRVIPGFGLSLGITFAWLGLIVLIPLLGVFVKTAGLGWAGIWHVWSDARVLSALRVSFTSALAAATFNAVMGTWVAWVFVRYHFPGRRLFDGLIDLPFALPTAVAGIALTALYGASGWIGRWLEQPVAALNESRSWLPPVAGLMAMVFVFGIVIARGLRHSGSGGALLVGRVSAVIAVLAGTGLVVFGVVAAYAAAVGGGWVSGIKVAYSQLGIVVALVFVGLPFVVRVVQPVLAESELELEEAAATLGASRWQSIVRVVLPGLWPAVLTGFALAFARAVGEYGSVIFIAGNMPHVTEIAPLLITIQLEEFHYADATAIATAMLLLSFAVLLAVNTLQLWLAAKGRRA